MTNNKPDWPRLQKALSVEAEHGFTDLMGKQYRFSEFLCLSFGQPPAAITESELLKWQEIASQFDRYPQLTLVERKHLVASASRFLLTSQHAGEHERQEEKEVTVKTEQSKIQNSKSKISAPATTPLVKSDTGVSLDQPLTNVAEIGVRKGEYLARLGLHTVRDLLFYYPRDHIDYARQVNICELEAGETVTLVGMVKRCTCFSSSKNKKLTILEVVLKDHSGQIRLSRFFAGNRYSNRGWQEAIKRNYPAGAVVAASGLVKINKYGLTLEDPQMEVLANPGDTIDSLTIGRVVPVYPLTEGVPADMVRQAVIAA
ncbi:MAG TPA: OB-fold nucleic acid binding domain-containing protein, partial [Candidatus Obscuribacterales bacterium]